MNKPIKAEAISQVFVAFRDNESIIKGFLRRFTSNAHDIDDICQETILRALEAEKTKEIHNPRAFLFGVTRNIVRKKLDRKSQLVIDFIEDSSPEECRSDEPSPEDALDDRQQMLIFAEAVATLPPQCQRVFVAKKVYGYSHKEIAAKLNISTSTIEKHVAAGLRRVSDYIQQELKDENSCPRDPSLFGSAYKPKTDIK